MSERITNLILPIKWKWFDMICKGEKKEEYREIKPYWTKRFRTIGLLKDSINGLVPSENCALITLKNGYAAYGATAKVWVRLTIGTGRTEWGAEPNETYYVLHILKVIAL
jgi:hypothetical protein